MLVFVEGRKPENPEKTLGARQEPTTNSTHVWHQARIEPKPHWWEASSLTTVPSLLPSPPVLGAKLDLNSGVHHKLIMRCPF